VTLLSLNRRRYGSPPFQRSVIFMPDKPKPNDSNQGDPDSDEDDWSTYASAGYAYSVVDTDETVETVESSKDEWFDGDDFEFQGSVINWDAPPCPAPLGIEHLIRIGSCDHCLQRLAGRRTAARGAAGGALIRSEARARNLDLESLEKPDLCPLCEDLFDDVENIVIRIIDQTGDVEHSSIQFGIHLPKDLVEEEDRIRTRHGSPGSQPMKPAFVNAIQDALLTSVNEVQFVKEKPDLMILVDGLTLRVSVDVRPVFLFGRYLKLERGIPQTRWPCRACRGRGGGCESCSGTGLQYLDSVQDLIGEPLRIALDAEDTSFHGMGREDIDVRCLGRGRPFVMEIKRPQRRSIDHEEIQKAINLSAKDRVEINSLRWSDRPEVRRVKETRSEKSYSIRFRVEEMPEEDFVIKSILGLSGVKLAQETPKRVSHRRAAKTRHRTVNSVSDVIVDGNEVQFTLQCEAGTYVKELIHSDEGRTVPSVRSVLGDLECEVLWLDVQEIHSE
jgi:tRNA pseudouridine synthase 10